MNYARHAEEVTKKKAKKNLTATFNLLTTGEDYTFSTIKMKEEDKEEDSEE